MNLQQNHSSFIDHVLILLRLVRNTLTKPPVLYYGASYSPKGTILDKIEAERIRRVEVFLIKQLNENLADFVAIWKFGSQRTSKIIIKNKDSIN